MSDPHREAQERYQQRNNYGTCKIDGHECFDRGFCHITGNRHKPKKGTVASDILHCANDFMLADYNTPEHMNFQCVNFTRDTTPCLAMDKDVTYICTLNEGHFGYHYDSHADIVFFTPDQEKRVMEGKPALGNWRGWE
jgi:hypothetical protein